jgi:hypothetical protein
MAAKKSVVKVQEIYAPKDVLIPMRLGGGVLKERVIRELPSKKSDQLCAGLHQSYDLQR